MKQIPVALLVGGLSSEHEISLRSGEFIYKTIDRNLFSVTPILISKQGEWWIPDIPEAVYPDPFQDSSKFEKDFKESNNLSESTGWISKLKNFKLVFLGLHGGSGEDGRIQGFLETMTLPYTGSGVLASALAMDKWRSNHLFSKTGFSIAPFLEINSQTRDYSLLDSIQFPVFIKPTLGGSSVLTAPASSKEEAISFLEKGFEKEKRFLVQEKIVGTEVSIGVVERPEKNNLGVWESVSLVPTEIRPKSSFFDYSAKYQKGGSEEITPAELPLPVTKRLQELAVLAHQVLGCKGYSRTDFIIRDGEPFLLETNTLPGMTGTSLLPQQAKAVGIEMQTIFTWLLKRAEASV